MLSIKTRFFRMYVRLPSLFFCVFILGDLKESALDVLENALVTETMHFKTKINGKHDQQQRRFNVLNLKNR